MTPRGANGRPEHHGHLPRRRGRHGDAHLQPAGRYFSAGRFGTLDRPTEFPPPGQWGYECSYTTWHAVAAWDFERP